MLYDKFTAELPNKNTYPNFLLGGHSRDCHIFDKVAREAHIPKQCGAKRRYTVQAQSEALKLKQDPNRQHAAYIWAISTSDKVQLRAEMKAL